MAGLIIHSQKLDYAFPKVTDLSGFNCPCALSYAIHSLSRVAAAPTNESSTVDQAIKIYIV